MTRTPLRFPARPPQVMLLVAVLAATACAHQAPSRLDPTLPENADPLSTADPLQVLESATQSEDPTPRARALGLLVVLSREPAGGRWGQQAIWDPHPWCQRIGIEALGTRLHEPETRAVLESYAAREEADPYIRGRAGMLLARIGSPRAAEVFGEAWKHESEPWRQAPLALAALAHGHPDAIAPLSEALRSGYLDLDVDFVLDIAHSGRAELLPALREGANWVEEELVLPYAVAQIALGDPSGEQVLRRSLNDPDENLQLETLDYLAELDHPEAMVLLRRARQGPEMVRIYAELALASRTGEGLDVIEHGMAHASPEIRALAVRFAARAVNGMASARAVSVPASPAIDGIGKRTARLVSKVVKSALEDESALVRAEALRAVFALGVKGTDALLEVNLRHDYLAVRIEAAGALLAAAHR